MPRILRRERTNTTTAEITRTPPIADPTPAPTLPPVDRPWLPPETALGVEVGKADGGGDEEDVPDSAAGELVGQGIRAGQYMMD
ncbi:MAG: hypothetical protein M1840_004635 [Geoglossum simile]|nr:MAG: hypothetical protein M1840_004635 [Geoglossum simile]